MEAAPNIAKQLQISTDVCKKVGHKTVYPGSPTYDNWEFHNTSSWISHTNPGDEFIEFEMITPVLVYGLALLGRSDCDQWITYYNIYLSKNGIDWKNLGKFKGSRDRSTPALAYFETPQLFSRIKLSNFEFHGHMCARVGLIIPKWN